jgi:hypothetical protein
MTVRLISEMPDDEEGTWFMTDVPGAPLQVVGRRAPTGELFAFIGVKKRGACLLLGLQLEAETGAIEVVSGPEAERLIGDFIEDFMR